MRLVCLLRGFRIAFLLSVVIMTKLMIVLLFLIAAGCKRTPKAELIRMDIVKKVTNYDNSRFCASDSSQSFTHRVR